MISCLLIQLYNILNWDYENPLISLIYSLLTHVQFSLSKKRGFSCEQLAKKLPKDVNMKGVFTANELNLNDIQVWAMDYDYSEYIPYSE